MVGKPNEKARKPFPCPECGGETWVTGGTHTPQGYKRYRKCNEKMCGIRFATTVKRKADTEIFDYISSSPEVDDSTIDNYWNWHYAMLRRKVWAATGSREKRNAKAWLKAIKAAREELGIE